MKNVLIFLAFTGTLTTQAYAAMTLPNVQEGIFIDLVDTSTATTRMPCNSSFQEMVCKKVF